MGSLQSGTGKFSREELKWLDVIPSLLGEVVESVTPLPHESQLFHLLHVLRQSRTFIEEQRALASFILVAVSTAGDSKKFAERLKETEVELPEDWADDEDLLIQLDRSGMEKLFHTWLKRHQGIRGFDDQEKVISYLARAVVNKTVHVFLSWWVGSLRSDDFTQPSNIKELLRCTLF